MLQSYANYIYSSKAKYLLLLELNLHLQINVRKVENVKVKMLQATHCCQTSSINFSKNQHNFFQTQKAQNLQHESL